MNWEPHALALALGFTHSASRWRGPVASTPRHVFVPRWWWPTETGQGHLAIGAEQPERWLSAAYADRTLVTRLGPLHADHAGPPDRPEWRSTSSSTHPSLVISMYRHAMIEDTSRTLCITGSGYGTALLCARVGDDRVTSVDVDPYLVQAAGERLGSIGLKPSMAVCDITGDLPGQYDRIVSTVSVPSIPASWLAALRPGGRLVTTLANTWLVITADKTEDGGAVGRTTWDGAAFMQARHGDDYPTHRQDLFEKIRDAEGDVTVSLYPVVDVRESPDLWSLYSLGLPGVEHWYEHEDGTRTAWMAHADGSWARATAEGTDPAEVHQGGPRRLWDELDRMRRWWLADGFLCAYGAKVTITPDGITTLTRSGWTATV